MKRLRLVKVKLIAAITATMTVCSLQSANAGTLFDTMSSTGSSYGFVTVVIGISPITIPAPATVQSIVMKIASGTGSGAKIDIYSDNSGSPAATSLGTLTFNSYSSPNATYSGSVSLPSAGKYWFKFSTTTSFQNYYSLSPVTTGSLSGWSIGRMLESTDSGATFATRSDNLAYLITINGTGGVLASSSTIALSANVSATYRQAVTITASLGVAGSDGLVTFFAQGKKIPGCIKKASNSLVATCNWKPSRRGNLAITAQLTPLDSAFNPSFASAINVRVANRSNSR